MGTMQDTQNPLTPSAARLTGAQRVQAYTARLLASGGARIPSGYLTPEQATMLADLLASGYAQTQSGVIVAALCDAHKKMCRAAKKPSVNR